MQGGASNSEIEELELALGDLSLTVRRRRSAVSSPTSAASTSSPSGAHPSPEPASSGPARVPLASPPVGEWEQALLQAREPRELDQVDLGPHSVFVRQLHVSSAPWTARARVARAVRAGLAAAAVLRGETEFVV